MKKPFILIGVLLLVMVGIFSCSTDKSSGFITDDNGTYYKVHYRGSDTTKAAESEIVTVNLSYRIEDSVIFNSMTLNDPMKFPIIKPMFEGDLYDALKLMGTGDSITAMVVADSFFLKTANLSELPNYIVPGSKLYYDVKLLSHVSNANFQAEMANKRKNDERHEKILLQKYLSDNEISTKPTVTGLYFIPIKKGRGQKPDTGNMCQVFLSVKTLNGDELFSNFNDRALDIEYGKKFDTKGFMEGLGMMKPGGIAQFIVPSWIGVGSSGLETVEPFTTLIYDVKLQAIRSIEEVKKDREQYEKEKIIENEQLKKNEPARIAKYLEKNNITIDPLSSGLYYKELVAGQGNYPIDGNSVTVQYIHYNLNGDVLQSSYTNNTPFSYIVGEGAVIPGWEEAVKKMKVGGKSWLLIPSNLGWGSQERTKDIGPYSPLVFELELTEIKK